MDDHLKERRVEKMNRIIKDELDIIVRREIRWKTGIMVTIVDVKTSVDLRRANVRVSVLPDAEREYLMKTLENERMNIQSALFKRLHKRIVPTIVFQFHKGGAHQTRVDELLREIHKSSEER